MTGTATALQSPELAALVDAATFITFCDGVEEAGLADFARFGRKIARELVRTLDSLDAERSARQAIQEDRDRCLAILATHAGEGCG